MLNPVKDLAGLAQTERRETDVSFSIESMTQAARTTPRAIRLWEKRGLLGPVARDDRNMRIFTAEQLERAKLIAAAQMAGMSLDEIRKAQKVTLYERITNAARFLQKTASVLPVEHDL